MTVVNKLPQMKLKYVQNTSNFAAECVAWGIVFKLFLKTDPKIQTISEICQFKIFQNDPNPIFSKAQGIMRDANP